jgi:hypothetical protein
MLTLVVNRWSLEDSGAAQTHHESAWGPTVVPWRHPLRQPVRVPNLVQTSPVL